jgi:hypothetical protein
LLSTAPAENRARPVDHAVVFAGVNEAGFAGGFARISP